MKIKKKFYYDGILLQIVTCEEPYFNSGATITMTRVVAPNGGKLPLQIQRNQTLKSIMAATITMLDGFKKRGADIEKELTQI